MRLGELLGLKWGTVEMTVGIYGHLIPSSNRGTVTQLDAVQPPATYIQPVKKEGL